MPPPGATVVGVLALQGDFPAHKASLQQAAGWAPELCIREVRRPADLDGLHALVLPGGESSTMWKLAVASGLVEPLRQCIEIGMPVLATCAGLILLATNVSPHQPSLALLDVEVERNGYGRQVHSGSQQLVGDRGFPACSGVFIRAPRITRIGADVEVLARWNRDPVLVRRNHVLAACFHPELADCHPLTQLFLESFSSLFFLERLSSRCFDPRSSDPLSE